MARPTKIDRLPAEIREAIGTLRRDGHTIDEILGHLRTLGVAPEEVSRTGLGEHLKRFDKMRARLADSRAAAEAIMDRIDKDGGDDKLTRVNISFLHSSIMGLFEAEDGEKVTFAPDEARDLSSAIKNLVSASKLDIDRIEKIEARATAKAKKEAAATAASVLRKAGVSQETMDEINRMLGVT
ncbi:phage protein Gp27 family protein [Methylobrevis pamukkalensis]|uniref:Mu-like prophage FluMu protein gp27 n=1 Tax=Methylobrevis pamukkalensis TaxID=1439726 RepID=A0A1E3H4B1_9HYPH|nr:phage protein Gp27 family protein [Methylobrevis pamukkalensis]ODN71187.1 hypothetical protein A6302_01476 [Methylobrevis pamukkalensis]